MVLMEGRAHRYRDCVALLGPLGSSSLRRALAPCAAVPRCRWRRKRQDRLQPLLPQSPLEILRLDRNLDHRRNLRGNGISRLPPAPVPRAHRQSHACRGGTGTGLWTLHAYQGWTNVIVISVLGILFGVLAAWRGNLRANMIVHAWADVWSGWLKFVVWRFVRIGGSGAPSPADPISLTP